MMNDVGSMNVFKVALSVRVPPQLFDVTRRKTIYKSTENNNNKTTKYVGIHLLRFFFLMFVVFFLQETNPNKP